MLKNILIIGLLIIVNHTISAQCVGNAFQKVYGGNGNDRGHSIINTSDGGFAVVGETDSFGAGGNDFFILKIDINGTTQWTKTYGGSAKEDGANIGIIQTINGDYIIHGYTESFGAGSNFDSYVLRLDNVGNIIWEKRVNGTEFESFRDVQELTNGDIIITGNSNSLSVSGDHDYHIMRLSSGGNIVWSKTYGGAGFDQSVGLIVDGTGNIYISGVTNSYGAGTLEGFIIKLDGNGNVLWQKTVGGSNYDFIYNSIILNDGNILTTGTTEFSSGGRDILVAKLDAATGNLIWAKAYGGGQQDYGINLRQKSNNEIIISANTLSFGSGMGMLLFSIDSIGTVNWTKVFGGGLNDEYEAWGLPMVLTQDGGMIMSGTTQNFGAISQDVYVIKTNSCGESFCNEQDVSLISINPPTTVLNTNLSVLSGLTLLNTNTQTSNITYNMLSLCDSNLVSVNEINDFQNNLMIYPNPVKGLITIKSNNLISEIVLYNSLGQVVYRNGNIEDKVIRVTTENLSSGFYIIAVQTNFGIERSRIYINH